MQYSRRFAGVIAVALVSVPFLTSALTLDELNQQIASLLSQVASLQQKIAAQSSVTVSSTTPTVISTSVPATSRYCPQLSRSLGIGARGEDVSSLQQFLIDQQLLPADSATGFFGALTQTAVQNWQSSHGVVTSGDAATTGYGMVGARTRSLIALNCTIASSVPPTTVTTAPSCRVANPPTSSCSTGWKPMKDAAGCVIAYDCATPLPTTPVSPNQCPVYSAPQCSSGSVLQGSGTDANGCQLPPRCVTIGNTTPYISINLPASAAQGSTITLTWNSWNAPANSAVVLTTSAGRIAQGLSTSGTYSWKIPGSNCDNGNPPSCWAALDNPNVWATKAGQTLQVSAQLYTPAGASLGGGLLAPSPDLVYVAKSSPMSLTITGNSTSASFSASPTSGTAPLNVYFSARTGNVIDFGDGTTAIMDPVTVMCQAMPGYTTSGSTGGCDAGVAKNHTYRSAGSYTAKLLKVAGAPENYLANSANLFQSEVIGTVTITVGSVSNPTFSAAPTSGTAPLSVNFGVSNIKGEKGYSIDFGDGSIGDVRVIGVTDCFSANCGGNIYGASHTYSSPGTYTAQLKNTFMNCSSWECLGSTIIMGTVTVSVGNSSATPDAVLAKYNTVAAQYGNSLGSSLRSCVKGSSQIYTVSGSGGFSGETHYYNTSGVLVGSVYFNDTPPFQTGTAPVIISEYSCTVLKTNGPQSN